MRYRGAVNYYVNLPANPTPGDVWVVRYQGSSGTIPNGHAYCWQEAAISSEKTYIGDIPAYRGLVNAQPDLVTWLTEIERKGLAWGAVTVHDGQIFFTPSSTDRPNLPNNYGQFLYPIGYTGDNRYLCLRKSDNCSGTASEQNIETYGFNYRHYYVSGSNFVLIEIPNPSHHSRITRRSISEDKYVNGQQYKAFNFERTNNSTGLSLPVQRSGSAYIYTPSYGGTYCDFASQYQNMQVANLVSNKLLFDSDGNIVQPGDGTYQYAYACAETELQWVDLGNLAETLPTDKGCIYYNGICYSAGGYNMDKYMLRKEPTGEGNFYMNLLPNEVGHGTITESKYLNNIIGKYVDPNVSSASVTITVGETGSAQPQFAGNIIWLSSVLRPSAFVNTGGAWANLIVGEGLIITGHNGGCNYNAIFGTNHTLTGGNVFDYNTIGGYNNYITISGTNCVEYNTIFGESNGIDGSAAYANVLMGYGNHAYTSSSDAEAILLGKANIAYTRGGVTNVLIGDGNVLVDGSYNYNNLLGHQNTAKGSELFLFGESNTATGSDSNSNCYRSYAIGIQNHLTDASYTGALGEGNSFSSCYENYALGYYCVQQNIKQSVTIGLWNYITAASNSDSYYHYSFGNGNEIRLNESGYAGEDSSYQYCNILLGQYNKVINSDQSTVLGYSNYVYPSDYNNVLQYEEPVVSRCVAEVGRYNYIYGGYYNYLFGEGNYSYGGENNILVGKYNYLYATTDYRDSHHNVIVGHDNTVTDSIYSAFLGGNNTSSDNQNVLILGYSNIISTVTNGIILAKGAEVSNTNNVIRLGFFPLSNTDFFAIGNGTDSSNKSSIVRIDSSNNIYLNSTVPTPPIPTSNGTYSLSVSNGASSWVSGGGGSSTLAGLTDVSLTTPSNGQILVYDSANSVWINANNSGGSNVPDKPISDGNYKLTIESGTAAWTVISGSGSINLPDAPLVDGIYQLDVTSGSPSWTAYTAPDAVIANPTGTATDTLNTLQIGSTIYEILGGSDLPSAPQVDGTYSLDVDNGTLSWVLAQSSEVPELPTTGGRYVLTATNNLFGRTTESGDSRVTEDGDARIGETGGSDITYSWEEAEESTEVIANPAGQATDTLNKLQVGSTIYDVPSGGSGSHTYSTTEQAVGTWIDNNTIYECVHTGLTIAVPAHNSAWINTNISAANVGVIVSAFCIDASGQYYPTQVVIFGATQTFGISFQCHTNRDITTIVLQYVK